MNLSSKVVEVAYCRRMSRESARVVVQGVGPGWVAEMEWPEGITQGGPAVLVIRPVDPDAVPDGGMSSTLLRGLDFRAALEKLRRQLDISDRRADLEEAYEDQRDERIRTELRGGMTDEYLSLISSRYVGLVNHGHARPLAALAEIIGKTESTVKGHLWRARRKELLTGGAGRAGGQLTPKASKVLATIVPRAPKRLTDEKAHEVDPADFS